jgi:hypothetical protein
LKSLKIDLKKSTLKDVFIFIDRLLVYTCTFNKQYTHEYGNVTLNKYDRAVLLIREPKEALLAEFNRRHGGHHGHAQKLDFRRGNIILML